MKISKVLVLFLVGLIPLKIQAQKRAELTCEAVQQILLSARNDFKDILGDLETQHLDCNYYYSKVSFGIDSTTTLQTCKGEKGRLTLHFDTYIGNKEEEADLEFKTLEDLLDQCFTNAKIKEIKPGDFRRIVEYRIEGVQLIAYEDKVKNARDIIPLVTLSVVKVK